MGIPGAPPALTVPVAFTPTGKSLLETELQERVLHPEQVPCVTCSEVPAGSALGLEGLRVALDRVCEDSAAPPASVAISATAVTPGRRRRSAVDAEWELQKPKPPRVVVAAAVVGSASMLDMDCEGQDGLYVDLTGSVLSGVGRSLAAEVKRLAKDEGKKWIALHALPPSSGFWGKLGFVHAHEADLSGIGFSLPDLEAVLAEKSHENDGSPMMLFLP